MDSHPNNTFIHSCIPSTYPLLFPISLPHLSLRSYKSFGFLPSPIYPILLLHAASTEQPGIGSTDAHGTTSKSSLRPADHHLGWGPSYTWLNNCASLRSSIGSFTAPGSGVYAAFARPSPPLFFRSHDDANSDIVILLCYHRAHPGATDRYSTLDSAAPPYAK